MCDDHLKINRDVNIINFFEKYEIPDDVKADIRELVIKSILDTEYQSLDTNIENINFNQPLSTICKHLQGRFGNPKFKTYSEDLSKLLKILDIEEEY